MSEAVSYELNTPQVAAETIDGEAVVIHLQRGSYFSLRGIGSSMWSLLLEGVPPQQMAEQLAGTYALEAATVAADVDGFVSLLLAEDLIRRRTEAAQAVVAAAVEPSAYATPVLEKFTDMEALLLLDPIHDVDERGWPHRPEG